jgi:hypothetical protein
MSNSTTCGEKTLDRERELYEKEIVRRLTELVDRLDKVESAIVDKLNESYQQGVADACKARTGHDPKVADDA